MSIEREKRKWDQAKKPQGTSPVTQVFLLGPTSRLAPDSDQVFIHMGLEETFHIQNAIEGTSQRFAGTGGGAVGYEDKLAQSIKDKCVPKCWS